MLTFQRITDLESLKTYNHNFQQLGGLPFQLEYLQKARVYAAYTANGEMVGGILFGERPYYRPLEYVQNEAAKERLRSYLVAKNTIEMAGLWLSKKHQKGAGRLIFWYQATRQVWKQPENHICCGAISPALAAFYGADPRTQEIYHGAIESGGKQYKLHFFAAPKSVLLTTLPIIVLKKSWRMAKIMWQKQLNIRKRKQKPNRSHKIKPQYKRAA